ncbi:ABC transporter ATP-binding protein [Candidatus Bipolaricaulota bacterium]|nr:ABC transporter ATP-binding protein [Candidatus Bipolaricaulota bacterium]
MSLLEANNIVSGYGRVDILHQVSMKFGADEIVTIIGPNGAGKSTFFKTVMGYLSPTDGSILLADEEVTYLPPDQKVKKGLGYVPQLDNVFPSLTVRENLEMGGYSMDKEQVKEGLNYAYQKFPVLKEKKGDKVKTLSGGQRQMLAMVRALMTNPLIILMDEPSAGLAPKIADEVFGLIERIHVEEGIGVVIVEQDAHRSLSMSDRGYVLAMGQNQFSGSAHKILHDDKIREAYLGG